MSYTAVLGTSVTLPATGLAIAGYLGAACVLVAAGCVGLIVASRLRHVRDATAAGVR